MNYFLTPQTKHCKHSVVGLSENIGEYEYLKYHIQVIYKELFQESYKNFAKIGRFQEEPPSNYTGKEVIQFTYSVNFNSSATMKEAMPSGAKRRNDNYDGVFSGFVNSMSPDKKATAKSYCTSIRKIMEELEIKDLKSFQDKIGFAEDYCTDRLVQAKKNEDLKMAKRYSDYRAAIRKYITFLEQQA